MPSAKGTGLLVTAGNQGLLGMTADPADAKASILYGVNVATGQVTFRKTIPYPLGVRIGSNQKEPFDFRLGPDGKLWTFLGGALVRINPADARIEVVGKLARGGRMALAGGDLYLAGGDSLRRVRGVLSRAVNPKDRKRAAAGRP